jgi:ABC-type sugar transport system ATPase subunit
MPDTYVPEARSGAGDAGSTLRAIGIRKSYGGVNALEDAAIAVRAGSVHALLGENGAGKSTLIKIITGAVRADEGTLLLDGKEVSFANTADAARNGVAVVSQELSLFPDLDVLSNLYPMREPKRGVFVNRALMLAQAEPVLRQLGLRVSPFQKVETLTLGERQLVEIAKALLTNPRVLILDEPTSALESASTARLMEVLRVMRERQVAVVFVSHILEEVMQMCDEVTVLRDGRVVLAGVSRTELSIDRIVKAMLGEKLIHQESRTQAPREQSGERGLSFANVTVEGQFSDVSFVAGPGEILGLTGLAGAGHQAVLQAAVGIRNISSGQMRLPDGQPIPRGLRAAIDSGVAYVSGDRRRFGLMLDKPVWENIGQVRAVALAREGGMIRKGPLRTRAREHIKDMRILPPDPERRAGLLSGGNQQKVVLAKWLDAEPSVLLLDDPTRGVDVGAKVEMHELIRRVARGGAITMMCSTDVDELVSLCHRVLVFYRGRLCAELSGATLDEHTVLETLNTGVTPTPAS